ncbi:MAG: AMP-binding protein [Bacteroidales bacterium]
MSSFIFDRSKQILNLDGELLNAELFKRGDIALPAEGIKRDIYLFLQEWFDASPLITVHTSGSTGVPKPMQVEKDRMQASAEFTCKYLGLSASSSALLCLPVSYIAGKMMLVRALVSGFRLDTTEVNGYPLAENNNSYDFVAMIPLQVYNSINDEVQRKRFETIRNVIVGGAAIDQELEERLRSFNNAVYSTYGMTETLSHIAMRRVSGEQSSPYYTPLDEVKLSLSDTGTLVISAPRVCPDVLVTNDCVEFNESGAFRVIGRADNVINSGGVKLHIEQIESKIASLFVRSFVITSVPDIKLGEQVVLLYEEAFEPAVLTGSLTRLLSRYEIPKHCFQIEHLPLTESGKIKRAECRKLALGQLK